jgi:hypothetical protein
VERLPARAREPAPSTAGGLGLLVARRQPQDPRLSATAAGAYRADPSEVVVSFLVAQERALRIRRQAAEVDAISIDLVRGLDEGMLSVLARYIPLDRELEALDALFAWQARLVSGIVRL